MNFNKSVSKVNLAFCKNPDIYERECMYSHTWTREFSAGSRANVLPGARPERKALNCNDSSLVIVDRIANDVREKWRSTALISPGAWWNCEKKRTKGMPLENSVFRSTLPEQKGSEFHFVRHKWQPVYIYFPSEAKRKMRARSSWKILLKISTFFSWIEKFNFNVTRVDQFFSKKRVRVWKLQVLQE